MSKSKDKIRSIRDDYSKGELPKEILKGLALGGLIVASFALPNLPQIFSLFGAKNYRERYKINRTLQRFKNRKLINIYKKNGEDIVEITEIGKKNVLKYKFDNMRINRPKKWDGCWRVIIFDIPERYKNGRDALTKKLKEMELYPLQKSVFICPFKCRDEIIFIGEIFNIRKYIHYLVVKELDEESEFDLKQHYNLI
jgi:DNA-binding transcriptional regulator PaaX